MSCVVAVRKNEEIVMASDSFFLANDMVLVGGSKCFKKIVSGCEMLLGIVGDIRFLNLVKYRLYFPEFCLNEIDELEYMITLFIPALQECLKVNGYSEIENNKHTQDSILLVALNNRIFSIYGDFCCIEIFDDYMAIGSGAKYALGALEATYIETASYVAELALRISSKFSEYVREPFYYEHIKKNYN